MVRKGFISKRHWEPKELGGTGILPMIRGVEYHAGETNLEWSRQKTIPVFDLEFDNRVNLEQVS
jgi:hypothetical protein